MKSFLKKLFVLSLSLFMSLSVISCGVNDKTDSDSKSIAEKIELSKATFSEIEFENDDATKIDKNNDTYTVSGTIIAMSESQKTAFGVDDVTHVVSLKFIFDKEKTISTFEIIGNTTKVFSVDSNVNNYVGSISDLLDNEENEDAYCNLILSANTSNYTFVAKYSDNTTSTIKLKITATLATSTAD